MAEITIDLKANGLTHAKGKSDACGGEHRVRFKLEDEALHADGDCLTGEVEAALQKLHESAHPGGAVFVVNCREPECSAIVEQLTEAWG